MSTDSLETLRRVVVAASDSTSWSSAVQEWVVTDLQEHPSGDGVCVCGQLHLVKLFTITNTVTSATLFPIGSVCVNQFGREDLDSDMRLLTDFLRLRTAIDTGARIRLTLDFFTRNMLEDLWYRDVFTPDQWNGGDGDNDYEFLRDMFNKRDKASITIGQRKKITALLLKKVIPAVRADERLR